MSILLELAVPLILAAVGIHALVSGADVFPAGRGAGTYNAQGYAADVNRAVPGGVHAACIGCIRRAVGALRACYGIYRRSSGDRAARAPASGKRRRCDRRRSRHHKKLRRGLARGAHGSRNDRLERDNVLRHCRIFRRGRCQTHALYTAGGAAGRSCGIYAVCVELPYALGIIRERAGNNSIT